MVSMAKVILSPELNQQITERVRALLAEHDLNPNILATRSGIDYSVLSRTLKGERGWTLGNVERLAAGFGIPIADIFKGGHPVPLVASISAAEGFDYSKVGSGEAIELVPCLVELEEPLRDRVYALKVEDRSFMPLFKQGATLYVLKDSAPEIEQDDLVIFHRESGNGELRRISFTEGPHIVLTSLNPSLAKELVVPKEHLKLLDKIIGARF